MPTLYIAIQYMMSNPFMWLLIRNGVCLDVSFVGVDGFDASDRDRDEVLVSYRSVFITLSI